MIADQVFRSKIDEFTKELCGKTYINRSLGVLYEKLSYLTPQDLRSALNAASFEFPQGILPIPVKLYEFIAIRFKRRESDNKVFNSGKYCRVCEDTGQVVRDLIKCDIGNPARVYRCFCDRGKSFSEDYFPTWSRKLHAMHHLRFGLNNQDNAGYSQDETVQLINTIPLINITDYNIFKNLDDKNLDDDVGLDLYINKEELSQLEIDICKDIYKDIYKE